MQELAERVWEVYRRSVDRRISALVVPSIPILFFGGYEKYSASPLLVITVGPNSSHFEFPRENRFARFPRAAYQDSRPPKRPEYLGALATYFRGRPHDKWLKPAFEVTLRGDTYQSEAFHSGCFAAYSLRNVHRAQQYRFDPVLVRGRH